MALAQQALRRGASTSDPVTREEGARRDATADRKTRAAGWRAVSAVALFIVLLIGSVGIPTPSAAQGAVTVPQIVGLSEADALSAIRASGLRAGTRGSAYDATVPACKVISSDPVAGTQVDPGVTAVNYVLSAGPPPQTGQPAPKPCPTPKPSPTPKPTPWPTPAGIKGVDVSHWNGAPNFGALRGHGMRFVFAKASQGTWLQDDMFVRNTQEARAAGLLPGAYHFFDYTKGGKQQAKHFLSTVAGTVGLGGLLPLVVDVETLKSLGTPNQPLARARLHALLDELYRQTGRYPMIYTSREMWQRVVGAPADFGPYRLWVACWRCDRIAMPNGWSDWDFWQVGLFRFPDIPSLDGNTFRSSDSKLRRQLQRDMKLNKGAEWSASTVTPADLSGYDGTEVRVALEDGAFGPWTPYQHPFPVELGNKQGPRAVQLQLRSYRGVPSPIISDAIQLDSVPPKVKGPWVGVDAGGQLSRKGNRVPLTATAQASDATSGLASTRIESSCGNRRSSRSRQAPEVRLQVTIDRSGCTVTGTGRDNLGHEASSSIGPRIKLHDVRERSRDLSFKGEWKTVRMKSALGGTLTQSSAPGARAKFRFQGAQYAVVARRGPSGGMLEVRVDGKRVATVDLFARKSDGRRIVHVGTVPRRKHVLELRAVGTARAKSTGATIWLDGILVLDRQK